MELDSLWTFEANSQIPPKLSDGLIQTHHNKSILTYNRFILLSIGLGLAGIDPLGALIVASAVAAGMKKRQVATFALVVFGGTVAMGVALSLGAVDRKSVV